jgi:hypothetical protein
MTIIDDLRAELAPFGDSPARLGTLVRLGQALMAEYNRVGPGRSEAKPYLDEGIDAFEQAHAIMQPDDPMRGPVGAMLGGMFGARHGVHGGATRDREEGIKILEEALTFPDMNSLQRAMARVSLGQLYLAGAMAYMQSSGMSIATRSIGLPAPDGAVRDVGRAIACFQSVLDGEPVSTDLTAIARTLVDVSEALRTVLGAVGGNVMDVDLSRLTQALEVMQRMQSQFRSGGAPTYRLPDSRLFDVDLSEFIQLPSAQRPVAVVQGALVQGPVEPGPGAPLQQSAPVVPPDLIDLRHALYALLPGADSDGWSAAGDLLLPSAPAPDVATVDEMVALGLTIVERTPETEATSATAAIDRYILAVALLLRGRNDETSSDRRAALEEYATAAMNIPLVHPAARVILRSLGAFVNEGHPLDAAVAAVAARVAGRMDSAIVAGIPAAADLVVLDALRCLARAAEALAELRLAAGKVPTEYPWSAAVRAAGQYAEAAASS